MIKHLKGENLVIPQTFDFKDYLGFITLVFENNMSVFAVYQQASNFNSSKHEMLNNSEIELFTWRLLEPDDGSEEPTQKLSPLLIMNLLNSHDLETLKTKVFGFVHQNELLCLQVPSIAKNQSNENIDDNEDNESVNSSFSNNVEELRRSHKVLLECNNNFKCAINYFS